MLHAMIFFPAHPIFTENQYDRLANILDNAGQVIFGIAVLTPLISNFASTNWFVLLLGLAVATAFWLISLVIARKGK